MFGLGGQKKKKGQEVHFDLEEDLKDPIKLRALKEKIDARSKQLKDQLRQGENKKVFDQAQTLLHGYLAVQKVLERVNRKKV